MVSFNSLLVLSFKLMNKDKKKQSLDDCVIVGVILGTSLASYNAFHFRTRWRYEWLSIKEYISRKYQIVRNTYRLNFIFYS